MAVIGLEISRRSVLADGKSFGSAGPYEYLTGTAQFAVDPAHARNAGITDLDLAPRGEDGRVHFDADVVVLRPVDPAKGNGRLFFDVLNRGLKLALRMFNGATGPETEAGPDSGDGFLLRQGYTLAWCGWQRDVPLGPGRMALRVPEALQGGKRLRGRLLVDIQVNQTVPTALLSDRAHQPYPATDLNDADASLTVRDRVFGERRLIPREHWRFARDEGGVPVPDPNYAYLDGGFEPGKLYEVIYTTEGAPVIGLGLLAARDAVAFLRYGSADAGNPCAASIERAYAFGASQSGCFLREFLYLGLNEDEEERWAFDGVIPDIAGQGRGFFNCRFGQPSYVPFWARGAGLFPFSDAVQQEPVTGQRDGLLARLEVRGKAPRVFHIISGTEYWNAGASLIHTDPAGQQDVAFPDNVRAYFMAGTQHGAGALPLTDRNALDGSRAQYPFNSVDYTPLLRAALVNLDAWVSRGAEPPALQVPRLSDGTAVSPADMAPTFPAIPGVTLPAEKPRVLRLDYGPGWSEGRMETLPPRQVGEPYPVLVSAVDPDGNDLAGIRLPDLTVPLATYAAWNLRHAEMGAPHMLMTTQGSTFPFARTAAERQATGDPRPSIAERYTSKEDYLQRVRQAATELVAARYLLEEDVEPLVERASLRWDLFTAAPEPVPASVDGGGSA